MNTSSGDCNCITYTEHEIRAEDPTGHTLPVEGSLPCLSRPT
jgi:hypothetical protein